MGILIGLTLSIIISLATYRQAFNSGLNLNLLMALQLPVQTLRAWNSKSLVCYRGTTEHLTWKDLCYLITLSTKLNPHTAHKTSRELCWHKVTGGQWVRGEFSSYNESRKTWWRYNQIWIDVQLDTQDQKVCKATSCNMYLLGWMGQYHMQGPRTERVCYLHRDKPVREYAHTFTS